MYSPKIKEELIPRIYKAARARGIRMTTLVNDILNMALNEMDGNENGKRDEDGGDSIRELSKDQK